MQAGAPVRIHHEHHESVQLVDEAVARTYRLPSIPFRRLRFSLEAREPALLPEWKGSLVRGAFGHALRRAVCAMGPAQPCATCRLRPACVYTRLFECFVEGSPPPFFRGIEVAPRPYVFEVDDTRRELAPGETTRFDLLLFGQAIPLEPYAVLAIERMGSGGLSARRFRFDMTGVERFEEVVKPPADEPARERFGLRFLTPTRLKVHGHLTDRPTVRQIAFHALRRVLEIAAFHVPGAEIDWDFRGLLEHAQRLVVEESRLEWRELRRYSNRQQSAMLLGGIVGQMTLAGDLAPLLPLLRAVEVLHLGKGATFGLGKVEVALA